MDKVQNKPNSSVQKEVGRKGVETRPKSYQVRSLGVSGVEQGCYIAKEFNETLRKTLGLEIEKQAFGIPSGLRTIKEWTSWRGRTPPKRKNLLALLAFDGPEMWEHRPRFKKKHFGLMVMHLD
jgi:hypothetical protein